MTDDPDQVCDLPAQERGTRKVLRSTETEVRQDQCRFHAAEQAQW